MITRPCSACRVLIQRETFDDRFCGAACAALHEQRQEAQERGSRPGDLDYTPTNSVQAMVHRKARRERSKE